MFSNTAIFQLGPVQKYITCAKRTQDYWSGSYILSYLSAVAIASVKQQQSVNIIYPFYETDELFMIVKDNPGNPKEHDFSKAKDYLGTLPNRLVAACDNRTDLESALGNAEENIRKAYHEILRKVRSRLETDINSLIVVGTPDPAWIEIWKRQNRDYIETFWIIYQNNSSLTYGENYKNAEKLLGARKGIRNFSQISGHGEPGEKCTLCGEYQALVRGGQQDARAFWKEVREWLYKSSLTKLRYTLREKERLCSICTAKRFAPSIVFDATTNNDMPLTFPSTSTLSVSPALDYLAQNWNDPRIRKAAQDFSIKFKSLDLKSFPFKNRSLPIIDSHLADKSKDMQEIFRWDGDAFIQDFYQKEKIYKVYEKNISSDIISKCQESLNKLLENLENKDAKDFHLSKYYAVIMMDGDDMGKMLSNCKSDKDHMEFSERLSIFSKTVVPLIAEQYFRAKVAYFGGDEGVIFVGLEDLLPLMRCLRAAFSGHIELNEDGKTYLIDFGKQGKDYIEDKARQKQYKIAGALATACTGAVVAHHQQSLLQVMEELHECLEGSAKKIEEKDAFCIALMKRSGGTTRAACKWYYPEPDIENGLDVISHLEKMKNLYREPDGLKKAWLYDLDREKHALITTGFNAEIRRLIMRHCGESYYDRIEPLIEESCNIVEEMWDTFDKDALENFIQLEFIANYIAKGGGN
ncbi:Putative CRISPR-associated protein Cas10/Cmr2 [Desulfonema limicola]|uniref:CRISPR-associated protein Cas10/Cmr2 n=1 Tax=Desulfonema limicola TaxID=45656 RepID=A0A975B7M3_9BACT|nr:type III-B CRISPR-associated protein Cas10/Cmr2 [Desulfonema limicola]QTA80259.1 Putative CRISPR-associated protein Cas10/Cmr2 [Desulfonema limicola]